MTLKEEINLPKAGLTPRGKVSIDLMDTEGNIVETHKKDNYVHTRLLEVIGNGLMRGAINSEHTGFPNGTNSSTGIVNQIGGIILTDNSASPNPAIERRVDGNIIGAGNNGAIHDSDWLGNYNSTESHIGLSYIKLVYDFPTNTANGTFQSIYTGPFQSLMADSVRNYRTLPQSILRTTGGRDDFMGEYAITGWSKLDNEFHFVNGTRFSRGLRHLNISNFTNMEDLYNAQSWTETLTLPQSVSGVTLDTKRGVYYFYVTGSTSAWNVWTAPYDDPTNFTLVLNRAISNINQYFMYGMVYDARTDTMLNVGSVISGTSTSGAFRASMPSLEPLEPLYTGLSSYPTLSLDGQILYTGTTSASYAIGYDLKNKRSLTSNRASYDSRAATYDVFRDLTEDLTLLGKYRSDSATIANNYVDLVPNFDFFSRAVLDSPVTKTAQNTMKITYEFTVDDFMV